MLILFLIVLLNGCASAGIALSKKKIEPPQNAEKQSTITENKSKKITEIPAGSTYVIETVSGTETKPETKREVITYTQPAKIVEDIERTLAVISPPAKPDVRVQMQKEQNSERRVLLYIALGSLAVAGILVYLRQIGPAIVSAIAGGASFLLWYLAGNEELMNYVLAVLGAAFIWWLYNRDKEARELKAKHAVAEGAMLRSVQSIEELKVDNPRVATEIKEYNEANMDQSHKDYIKLLKNKIDRKYIVNRISEIQENNNGNTSKGVTHIS
jgi:hypothetical protein